MKRQWIVIDNHQLKSVSGDETKFEDQYEWKPFSGYANCFNLLFVQ